MKASVLAAMYRHTASSVISASFQLYMNIMRSVTDAIRPSTIASTKLVVRVR
ncbi:hypothetical protein D3C71_1579770 [compost metagenome]